METLTDHHETAEQLLAPPERHELLRAHTEAPKTAEKDPAVAALEARQEIRHMQTESNPLEQLEAAEAAPEPSQHTVINRQLKQITLRRELKQLQRKESRPERVLSRLIHQPAVRALSETAGQTISRPSGLLGGSLTAFVGTTGYLYSARHYGWRYNYLVFLFLMAAGFGLGLVLELLVHLATAGRRQHD
jgi:hypothetical protein